ncbi:MAG: amidase [bacterium]|nr:amidase [bacterium]
MNRLFLDNSIGAIIKKMRSKKISAKEVLSASLENIEKLNLKYFPFEVYRDKDWKPREPRSPMDGHVVRSPLLENIPVAVKDIYNTYDFPTQMGSPLWKGFTPGNDARTVYHLKHQGAIVVGKTVTAEFAVHALDKTLNPWDITKGPGTSSSGSAVAITLGMVPLATGTQTAGSIVRPASFCGVYGCKPSFGTIPRTGTLKTTDSLDTLGFLAIHQEDLRRGFNSMRVSGLDYPISDSALSDESRQKKSANRPWRVGFVKTHTWEHAPQYAKDAIQKYVQQLGNKKGIEVTESALPKRAERAHIIHETIYNKALSYYFKGEHKQSDFVSKVMNELIASGNQISLADYTKAIDDQMEFIYDMDTWFKKYDILISLSTAGEAPPRNVTELPDPALMWTLAHLPVVSVPAFKSPDGLPFGFQVAARKYNDYLLFSFLDHLASIRLIPPKAGYYA